MFVRTVLSDDCLEIGEHVHRYGDILNILGEFAVCIANRTLNDRLTVVWRYTVIAVARDKQGHRQSKQF